MSGPLALEISELTFVKAFYDSALASPKQLRNLLRVTALKQRYVAKPTRYDFLNILKLCSDLFRDLLVEYKCPVRNSV